MSKKKKPDRINVDDYWKGKQDSIWYMETGKFAQVSKLLEDYRLMFMGLSEVRWNESGERVTSKGHQLLWSGKPNQSDPHQYGVGILVNRLIRQSIMSYKFISERGLDVRLEI